MDEEKLLTNVSMAKAFIKIGKATALAKTDKYIHIHYQLINLKYKYHTYVTLGYHVNL